MISIDTVYQKVLALANKEQRGYITPQEFNLFADQAQKEIFEQYFYDLNQFNRTPGNSGEYSDIIHNLNEKIAIFESTANINAGPNKGRILATDFWRLGTVIYNGVTEVEEVQQNEILYINKSPLTKPTTNRPVYVRIAEKEINAYPSNQNLTYTYIRKPLKPSWGYFVVGNKALYDGSSTKTTNFELHLSEESELIYRILAYAGVAIEKPQLTQVAAELQTAQVQQEKQ